MTAGRDQGAAALELALCLAVLLGIAGFVLPLPAALLEQSRAQEAANRTVRWATSAPASRRGLPRDPAQQPAAVQTEGEAAAVAAGLDPTGLSVRLAPVGAPHCPNGRARTVTLSRARDLGPLFSLVNAVLPAPRSGPPTLTARATACEE